MTTLRPRALVSLAAAMAAATAGTLALGACAAGPSRAARSRPAWSPAAWTEAADPEARPLSVRFDNGARGQVHVYLITAQGEWLLGRVEPGALATLRIPPAALAGPPGFVRLAVLEGARLTPQAGRDARAVLTIAQPASAFAAQRWTFAQGQLTPLQLAGARTVGRR